MGDRRRNTELAHKCVPHFFARSLDGHRRIAEQRPQPEPVEQRDHTHGDAVGVAGSKSPRLDRLDEPRRACARRAGRRWAAAPGGERRAATARPIAPSPSPARPEAAGTARPCRAAAAGSPGRRCPRCGCRRRARTSARAPRPAGPRASRSGSARARSRRPHPSQCERCGRHRSRRARSARSPRRGSAPDSSWITRRTCGETPRGSSDHDHRRYASATILSKSWTVLSTSV